MYQYVVKRMLLMIPTLIGAALLVFFLLRLLPGDVCEVRLAGTGLFASQEDIDICRKDLGLDDPLHEQFIDFIGGYFTGDLGKSMWTGQPVTHEIQVRFKLSLQLAIMSTLVAVIIALPLGIISAVKQNTWIRLRRAGVQHCRHRHPVVLARHHDHPGAADHHPGGVRGGLDAADQLRLPVRGSAREPRAAHLAGRLATGLPVLRGRHAHDPLRDAGGAAGRTTCGPPARRDSSSGWSSTGMP